MNARKIGSCWLVECTAIAFSAGEAAEADRQNAIFVRDCDDEYCDADAVLFGGYALDEIDEDDWEDICKYDSEAFSAYQDDLDSVLIDGTPLSYFDYYWRE